VRREKLKGFILFILSNITGFAPTIGISRIRSYKDVREQQRE